MNINQVNEKLEAEESFTPEEIAALEENINDKDLNPYRRIRDALQKLDVLATGTREEMIPRLLENLPVKESEASSDDDDDLIPSAEGEAGAPGDDGEDGEGVAGADGDENPDPGSETPPPPPAADSPPAPASQPTIGADDMADAQRAAEQAAAEEKAEKTTNADQVRPPEESEEDKQRKAQEMEEAEAKAKAEREEREAEEAKKREEEEAKEREAQEAKEKAEAEAKAKAEKAAKKTAKSEQKKAFEEGCKRHDIEEDYLPRIKKHITKGRTLAQLKDGTRRVFHTKPEDGGRRQAETSLGYDLDFIWNDFEKFLG